jgi:uracil-DNA glycosylase
MTQIAIIGEAWGENEERERQPFVGAAGYELTKMLAEAGIHRADCFLTNVFNLRPPGLPELGPKGRNAVESLCGGKETAIKGYPALIKGRYVHERYTEELVRLADELIHYDPNLVIACGNTPMWAMLGRTAVSKFRGTTAISTHTASGFKVLPTYHPSAVLRQWELRPVTVVDLIKAKRESTTPDMIRPEVEIHIPETVEEIHAFRSVHIDGAGTLAVDIETAGNQITCLGLAPNRGLAIVIPFYDPRGVGRSYWPTHKDELAAWRVIAEILSSPRPSKVFQNGMYDITFLWRAYGIKVMGAEHDTMLLHHALQPESLKGLGFLGSVYTDHGAWKQDRRTATIKRDE